MMSLLRARAFFVIYLLPLWLLLSSCGDKELDEKAPFTLKAGRYRDYFTALKMKERLGDMGLPSYLVLQNTKNEGQWFLLLIGAYSTLEKAMANRIAFEDEHSLLYLSIENYNKLEKELIPIDESSIDLPFLDISFPEVGPSLEQMLAQLPYNPGCRLADVKIVLRQDSVDVAKFSTFKATEFDLPRGIAPAELIAFTEGFAKVTYEDDLVGNQFVVHCMKLRKEQIPAADMVGYIADKIINTRTYNMQERHDVTVDAASTYSGIIVTIEPKSGRLAYYLILTDPDKEYLVFVQSPRATREQILVFAKSIGQGRGLVGYPDFFNAFAILPEKAAQRKPLFLFSLERLRGQRGSFGPILENNLRSEHLFNDTENGVWGLRQTIFYQPQVADAWFTRQHPRKSWRDSVQVGELSARMIAKRRSLKNSRQTAEIAEELHWKAGNSVVEISNRGVAYLSQAEMKAFAEQLRLNAPRTDAKNWLGF